VASIVLWWRSGRVELQSNCDA